MKKISFFLSILLLASCTSNTIYKKPKDLIPKDTMVLLITDMLLANSSKHVKNKHLEKINYMPLVYDMYKIDTARFKKSNVYYTSKIDEYEAIFTAVKNNLEKNQKKYVVLKKHNDSIRKDSLEATKSKFREKFKKNYEIEKLPKIKKEMLKRKKMRLIKPTLK